MIASRPFIPVLPVIAAAPARHDQNSHPICQVEHLVAAQLAFPANRVRMHVLHIIELFDKALFRLASLG